MKWAITTTLKCPAEQTIAFVNYYLNIGADHIFLFFDDPDDSTAEIVGSHPRVTATRCTPEYFKEHIRGYFSQFDYSYVIYRQRLNATNALKWAREMNIDWISHVDVDELIHLRRGDLRKILKKSPFGVIRMTIYEAIPEMLEFKNFFSEIRFFKAPAAFGRTGLRFPLNSLMLRLAIIAGVKSPFAIHDAYFRGHYKSKCFVRTDQDIVDMQIHAPKLSRRYAEIRSRRIILLHFDSCGLELWKKRWEFRLSNGDRPASKKKTHKVNRHMQGLIDGEAADEQYIESYKKLHFIENKDRSTLMRLGLIKGIQLPDSLFRGAI